MLDTPLAKELIRAGAQRIAEHQDELSRLDALAGDGDHGVNMATALSEATNRLENLDESTPADVFGTTGRAFHDTVGGAAGALFGAFLGAIASHLRRSPNPAGPEDFVVGLEKGLGRVTRIGRVTPGQKTMVDALAPAVQDARMTLGDDSSFATVLSHAARAARQGAQATAAMEPQAGRARYAAEQSTGTKDPGACTVAYLFEAWAETAAEGLNSDK